MMTTTTKTRVTQIEIGQSIDFDAHTGCTVFYDDSIRAEDGSALPYAGWERVTGQHVVADRIDSTDRTHSGPLHGRARIVTLTLDNGRPITLSQQSKLPVQVVA